MKIKRCVRIILVATLTWFVLTTIIGCAPKTVTPVDTGSTEVVCSQTLGSQVCDFKLIDQNGEDFNLYDHRGKVIILDFSVMWCGPCRMAAMDADPLVEKYGEDNLVYVTLLIENSYGEDPNLSDLEAWAKAYGIKINPVLGASRDFLNVVDYHITGWPTFYFIDKNMILRGSLVGWSGPMVENEISKLLKEQDTGF